VNFIFNKIKLYLNVAKSINDFIVITVMKKASFSGLLTPKKRPFLRVMQSGVALLIMISTTLAYSSATVLLKAPAGSGLKDTCYDCLHDYVDTMKKVQRKVWVRLDYTWSYKKSGLRTSDKCTKLEPMIPSTPSLTDYESQGYKPYYNNNKDNPCSHQGVVYK